MRRTNNRGLVFGQKPVRRPVQWVAHVYAKILIGKNIVALPDNESTKGPVAVTNLEFPASGIVQVVHTTYLNFLFPHSVGLSFHGATLKSNNMPGIARAVHSRKNRVQPICSTSTPVIAAANTLGTDANAVNRAS